MAKDDQEKFEEIPLTNKDNVNLKQNKDLIKMSSHNDAVASIDKEILMELTFYVPFSQLQSNLTRNILLKLWIINMM